jgi:hypothetical protein
MKRIYHPYWKWEDLEMWRKLPSNEENAMLTKAIALTGNHVLYGEWMQKVILDWNNSCQHNLTDTHNNQQAWIGHAACQMAIGSPEYLTRKAWRFLTTEQQDLANQQADKAINDWKNNNRNESKQLCLQMD